MNVSILVLASGVVTLATRVLYSDLIAPQLSAAWKARAAMLLGILGGALAAAADGRPWYEAATAGILVGAGSIGIYELDKGRAAPLLKKVVQPPAGGPGGDVAGG